MIRISNNERGFTLVEALVSLLILTIGLIPAYYLAQTAQGVGNSIRDNVVAANLAQEGAEVIHAIRDTNWFTAQAFNAGLGAGSYEVEWNSEVPLAAFADRYLRLDTNGRYNYTTGTTTSFKREIIITAVTAQEIKVISRVTWSERNRARMLELESHLFDWK